MKNFIEEYANYTKQSILNCELMEREIKEKSIAEIDKTLRFAKKQLLTVNEAISRILNCDCGDYLYQYKCSENIWKR